MPAGRGGRGAVGELDLVKVRALAQKVWTKTTPALSTWGGLRSSLSFRLPSVCANPTHLWIEPTARLPWFPYRLGQRRCSFPYRLDRLAHARGQGRHRPCHPVRCRAARGRGSLSWIERSKRRGWYGANAVAAPAIDTVRSPKRPCPLQRVSVRKLDEVGRGKLGDG